MKQHSIHSTGDIRHKASHAPHTQYRGLQHREHNLLQGATNMKQNNVHNNWSYLRY